MMIQVRNVPDAVHRILKARAAASGTSLSDNVKRDLELAASRPSREELDGRVAGRGPSGLGPTRYSGRCTTRARTDGAVAVQDASVVVEVAHVIRRAHQLGELSATRARAALEDLRELPLRRAGHLGLLERAWALRANVTLDDGLYVALAERLAMPLVTLDRRVAQAPGVRAAIELVPLEGGS